MYSISKIFPKLEISGTMFLGIMNDQGLDEGRDAANLAFLNLLAGNKIKNSSWGWLGRSSSVGVVFVSVSFP